MEGLGRSIVADFVGCNPGILNDLAVIKQAMLDAAAACNATVFGTLEQQFEPQGVTVIVGIMESHLAIHTWPEHGCAMVDFVTCSGHMDMNAALEKLAQVLEAKDWSVSPEATRLHRDMIKKPGG